MSPSSDPGSANVIGVLLLVVITLVMAALVLLMLAALPQIWSDPEVPVVFEITQVRHTSENGILNYDSYLELTNVGDRKYDNRKLYARTYRNGKLLPVIIPIMNGHMFIDMHPYGIQYLGGMGSHDFSWNPGTTLFIDYTDKTFHPGDIVQFEVYDRDTHQIISRDIWPHQDRKTEKLLNRLFSHRGV